jgi:hypothetical protein
MPTSGGGLGIMDVGCGALEVGMGLVCGPCDSLTCADF